MRRGPDCRRHQTIPKPVTPRSIGILGGSFDPVHIGHLALANYLAQFTWLDTVWLVLSPQNPFKSDSQLAADSHRWAMLRLALDPDSVIAPCDIELTMPRPSYMIDTLRRLKALHPADRFVLVIGSDNWSNFPRWCESDAIINEFGVMIYPRPGFDIDPATLPANVTFVPAPQVDLSSTVIRKAIAQGLDVNYLLPHGVYQYIISHHLYQP